MIGRARGAIGRGNNVDFDRVGKLLLNDIRSGTLGRLSFETPEIMHTELQELTILREQKRAEKEQRKQQRRQKFLTKKRK